MDFYDVTSISSTLQEVAVRVIGNEKCKTYPDYSDKLQDTMICAGYKVCKHFVQSPKWNWRPKTPTGKKQHFDWRNFHYWIMVFPFFTSWFLFPEIHLYVDNLISKIGWWSRRLCRRFRWFPYLQAKCWWTMDILWYHILGYWVCETRSTGSLCSSTTLCNLDQGTNRYWIIN